MFDASWLRNRGYHIVGDQALHLPQDASRVSQHTQGSDEPEATSLAKVRRFAKRHGYLTYHVFDSRGSECGFPDLVLVKSSRPSSTPRVGRLIFAECKSARGKLTGKQHIWLDVLKRSVPGIEIYLWRPADWPAIQELLR
jgi:hypothetical protein